jgi:lysophospholipase L1-like esterase
MLLIIIIDLYPKFCSKNLPLNKQILKTIGMIIKRKITLSFILLFILCSFSAPPKTKLNIVFIGDSITFGSQLGVPALYAPPIHTCSYLLQNPNYRDIEISNQGLSGKTTLDYLPSAGKIFNNVIKAADLFYKDKEGTLVFSFMLGTNDSAIKGPHGSPVSPSDYQANLKIIADSLLTAYPECKIVFNYPIWYSPSTYNTSKYLEEGLNRLQTYFPQIDALVAGYKITQKGRVFSGDKMAFEYFKKNFLTELVPEQGQQGIFYLHPNRKGAAALGVFWGKAISRVIK